VSSDEAMDEAFAAIAAKWGKIDYLVHAIGFADKNFLRGRFLDTPREAFLQALDISCYSFVAVGRRAAALMPDGGSLLTLTYLGAERVMPHYNVMGVAKAALEASIRYMAADLGAQQIRVNGISAGPIKTLASAGIGDFHYILKWNKYNAPMERNVELEEVGGAGLYMLSDLSKAVTGEVHHVDCGYHVVGMKNPNAPDLGLAPD
jgi:enoyl-[acyl-carrier protein] reductase I